MKTLEVTDDQYAFIQHLREEISEQVVGKYGYVRERDAVQFLIDNLDGDLDVDAAFDADEMAAVAEELSFDEDEQGDEADSDGDQAGDADGDDGGDADDDDSGEDGNDSDADANDGAAADDDMLDRMMNLLDTHDEKWDESPSADYRYRVDLPDGSTEDVQTKDDVRALLFKHY